jgi:hypothetical protein
MTTSAFPLRLAKETNSTATAFTAKIPVVTKPSGDGVHNLFDPNYGYATGTWTPDYIQIIPFGTNGDGDTFDARLWGWSKVYSEELWVPQLIAEMSIVLGNISGAAIAANTFLADSITVDIGTTSGLIQTANDTPASVLFHVRGCDLLEFDFDLAGAQEGVSMNAYWRLMHSIR